MTATFLLVLLIGFGAATLTFLIAARGLTRNSKWLGLVAIVLAAPFFFWLGGFSERFVSGQCYTRSVDLIANSVARTDDPVELAEKIRSLPFYGYETQCSEVEFASSKLPKAAAP
jgi:hypothetical protein